MSEESENTVPVFMPALSAVLLSAEDNKGEPLTYDEVIRLRDKAHCIMIRRESVQKLAESRGYDDIDPENCWHDWQVLRRELGRKPDLDPGPRFNYASSEDPEYQQTIQDARNTLDQFRTLLPPDGSPRFDALVKIKIVDGGNSAFMWLSGTRMDGDHFAAELFEVPGTFQKHSVGDTLKVAPDTLLDWMVNDGGVLHGGFSLRYHRARLRDSEKPAYDAHIGVTEYA